MSTIPILYLIDGTTYIYRAYHAIRGLSNSNGLPTNAILGFTKMIMKLQQDKSPEHWAICFDVKGLTFRHKIYEQYKANRPPMPEDLSVQIPYIKKISEAFNLSIIEKQGYEADDLIGTLKRLAENSGLSVVMVTGDKDFIQLVTEKSYIWDPMKNKELDINTVSDIYGLTPLQMIDVMGLSGDKSDNIPGVPGIGPKTALSLIKRYNNFKRLYENVHKITKKKQKEKLIEFKDMALLSKKLVTIDTKVPLSFEPETFKYKEPNTEKLSKLFKELEFKQLQQVFFKKKDLVKKNYKIIFTIKELSALIKSLERTKLFAIDTETTSVDPMRAKLVGISFSFAPHKAFYIPIAHDYENAPKQLDLKDLVKALMPILENFQIKKVGQNIKYDMIILLRHGFKVEGVVFDTMLASYLINPSKRIHNLGQIAIDFLDYKMISFEEVVGKNVSFSKVPIEKAYIYACADADITLLAYNILLPIIKKNDLYELFQNIEMPLIPVLMNMELTGICVDNKKLNLLSKSFEHRLENLENQIYAIAGEKFNINSSQQLGEILFEKIKLPIQKRTKKTKKYSTDVDVLKILSAHHKLPELILSHRTIAKLKSTYSDALSELINHKTNRIHTSYNQSVTATGRLSSSKPNLQNIPVRTDDGKEIRKAFIPQNGWLLVSADYSQIELRILAHCSEDEILIEAFKNNEDIHTRTAVEIFQVFPSFISPDLRRQAKIINFGIIYGMSAFKLSKELSISHKMAKTYIDNYFARYKGVKNFIKKTIEEARNSGKTNTLAGRIRYLPDIDSTNMHIRKFAERTAVNTPIQGTAADFIKTAMINIDNLLKKNNLKSAMLLSVHDELIFEVAPEEYKVIFKLIKETMEGVWKLKVPLKVNIKKGKSWADIH